MRKKLETNNSKTSRIKKKKRKGKNMENKELKVLELFSGIRATSEALRRQGVDHKTFPVEFDKKVQEVANALWDTNEPTRDVTKILDPEYEENILGKDFDMVVAGFPCQPFSIAGRKLGTKDPRGNLYKDTLNVVEYVKPKYVIFENVKNILNQSNKHVIIEIEDQLKEWGYNVSTQLINAGEFSHQERERVFIIGTKTNTIDTIRGNIEPIENISEMLDMNQPYNKTAKQWFKKNDRIFYKNYEDGRDVPQKKWEASYNRIRNPFYNKKFPTLVCGNETKISIGETNDKGQLLWRELLPLERMLITGWTQEQYQKVKHFAKTNIRKVTGNTMSIDVMQAITKELLK